MIIDPLTKDVILLIGDIIIAASAAVVAIFTAIGVSKWRSEMKGKARFDIARDTVGLINQFRDQYVSARNITIYFQEYSDRDKRDEEGKKEAEYRNEFYARDKRVKLLYDTLKELREISWQADIVFKKDFSNQLKPFRRTYKDLRIAVDIYFSRYLERAIAGTTPDESDDPWLDFYRKTIYGVEGDEHSKTVDKAVDDFINYLKKEI